MVLKNGNVCGELIHARVETIMGTTVDVQLPCQKRKGHHISAGVGVDRIHSWRIESPADRRHLESF